MQKLLSLSVMAMLCLTVMACTSMPPRLPVAENKRAMESLRLDSGDRITLIVYGEETLSRPYMVDEGGYVNIPLIGPVMARGLTIAELEKAIAKNLKSGGFQQDPFVTVEPTALRPISVLGEVVKAGSVPFTPHMRVTEAVALSGGFTPRAASTNISLSRVRGGEVLRFHVNGDAVLLPGDQITVHQRLF